MPTSKTQLSDYGFSYANTVENSTDLKLHTLEECNNGEDIYSRIISSDNILKNILKPNQNFFYKIDHVTCKTNKQKIISTEKGVGEIIKKGRNFYLKREICLTFFDGRIETLIKSQNHHRYNNEDILLISSYVPENYSDIFIYPYSILCSINSFVPTPVELQEKNLIGRLDDTIQAIDKDELRQILTDQNIVNAISENKEELNINSSINIIHKNSKLASPVIIIKPEHSNTIKPNKPQRGSIIFNADENCFEGYDGRKWRRLKWGDE